MNPSKLRQFPHLPFPWLRPPPPPPPSIHTRTRIHTRTPITISSSSVLRTIKDPRSTLKQILSAFSSASRHPNFRHSHETYQALISLLSRRRQLRVAGVVLSLMRRRRGGLPPGPTVLIPLIEAYSAAGRHADAADLFLRFPVSNEVFSFLFKTLVADGQLDVAESLFSKAADLGFQIQVRYYNALIKGFCDNLRVDDGIRVFKGMVSSGVSPDVITLMNPLGKEGRVLEANALFRNMLVNGVLPDVASHKILFRMYWRNRVVSDAVGVLRAMVFKGLLGEEEVLGLDGKVVREGILGAILKRGSMGFFEGDLKDSSQHYRTLAFVGMSDLYGKNQ